MHGFKVGDRLRYKIEPELDTDAHLNVHITDTARYTPPTEPASPKYCCFSCGKRGYCKYSDSACYCLDRYNAYHETQCLVLHPDMEFCEANKPVGCWQPKEADEPCLVLGTGEGNVVFALGPKHPPSAKEIARRQRDEAKHLCACGQVAYIQAPDMPIWVCADCAHAHHEMHRVLYPDTESPALPKHPRRQYITKQHPKVEVSAKFRYQSRSEPLVGGPFIGYI